MATHFETVILCLNDTIPIPALQSVSLSHSPSDSGVRGDAWVKPSAIHTAPLTQSTFEVSLAANGIRSCLQVDHAASAQDNAITYRHDSVFLFSLQVLKRGLPAVNAIGGLGPDLDRYLDIHSTREDHAVHNTETVPRAQAMASTGHHSDGLSLTTIRSALGI